MAFDPQKARVANQLIQQGVSQEQALSQAGVADQDFDFYSVNEIGTPTTNPNFGQIESSSFSGIQSRPDQTVVPRGQDPDIEDDEDIFQRATVTSQNTTTTQTTQITGGGSTTRRVVPTQYQDNATSRALQDQATDLQAQKDERARVIRAQGGSGADVLRDPEFRRLSNEQTQVEYDAESARTPIPNTGGIITTTTPGVNETTTTQTVDGNFVTTRGSGFDPQAQSIEADNTAQFTPVNSFAPTDVTADDIAAVGQFQAGAADDVPTSFGTDTEDTFAGDGYGFVYNEDGELIPSDSAEADRIRSTPDNTAVDFAGDGYGFDYDENGELIPSDSADAERIRAEAVPQLDPYEIDGLGVGELTDEELAQQDGNLVRSPDAPLDISVVFEEDLGGWIVLDNKTGNVVADGFDTRAEAEQELARLTGDSLGTPSQADVRRSDNRIDEEAQAEADTKARLAQAQQQATIQTRLNQTTTGGDWRVRIRLAPAADYLYKDPSNALLRPLAASDGVVFPYVPQIQTSYNADYEKYNLTHSNFRGYFYKSSHVGDIQLTAKFTAQDTREAQYVLAVIHFFRSVTKMFYGKDALRGAPPPFVELSGFGQFQFNNHPCLVSSFNYNLPDGVDYIRVDPNNQGLNLTPRRNLSASGAPNTLSGVTDRLKNAGLWPGASPAQSPSRADLGGVQSSVNGTGTTTYVPTLMEIQLVLLPMQTRSQVSQLFSLKEFANGSLLKGGFW